MTNQNQCIFCKSPNPNKSAANDQKTIHFCQTCYNDRFYFIESEGTDNRYIKYHKEKYIIKELKQNL